jgi:replication factor A1
VTKDLKSHIDDIINALGDKSEIEFTREELENELNKFIDYGVPIEQAKQTLIKKYGGIAVLNSSDQSSERKLISDLQPNERSVNLLCRVVAINPKEITVKGDTRKIFYGIFGDESGTIQFTSWKSDINIEKGDVVEISNAYTREWQGTIQLNLGDRVNINKTDKDKLPDIILEPKELKIKDLRSGIGPVDILARIVEIKEREVKVNDKTKKVFSGIIADETGKAQFTSWHDFKIKKGEVFRITGGYIKSWKGIPKLTFDEKAKIIKLEKSTIPKKDFEFVKMPMHSLIEKRGALDVEVEGDIIEIRPGSGIIMRCPECNRSLQNGECSIHGQVEGKTDLRLKLVVDDGTGSISTVLNREITEKLIEKSFEECKKISEKEFLNIINKKLFAHKISINGNALGDEFGVNIIAKNAKLVEENIKDEARKLLQKLEDLQ